MSNTITIKFFVVCLSLFGSTITANSYFDVVDEVDEDVNTVELEEGAFSLPSPTATGFCTNDFLNGSRECLTTGLVYMDGCNNALVQRTDNWCKFEDGSEACCGDSKDCCEITGAGIFLMTFLLLITIVSIIVISCACCRCCPFYERLCIAKRRQSNKMNAEVYDSDDGATVPDVPDVPEPTTQECECVL